MFLRSKQTSFHPRTQRGAAFTLIELLVVIAIIAILAAILFPVFGRARENARRSSCQSNLKQISLGIKQYTQDYDEKFPQAVSTYDGLDAPLGWADGVQPYIKTYQIMQCPSEPNEQSQAAKASDFGYSDYWYNASLSWNGSATAPDYSVGVTEAQLSYSSLTVMLGDGGDRNARYRCNGFESETSPSASVPTLSGATPGVATNLGRTASLTADGSTRHLNGINLAFADGHVKWSKGNTATSKTNVKGDRIYNAVTPFDVSQQSPTFAVN